MTMTPEAKRELSKTIRSLRARLLEDLHAATEGAYRLSIKAKDAKLNEAGRVRRERLEGWVAEQVRALPASQQAGAAERFRFEVEKDAASTLLNRIVYLRLLEAAGLRREKLITGGWESRGYKDFRELAPELVHNDPTEGYATLLSLVFDDLAMELPGLYGDVRLTSLIPMPAATLRAVIEALDAEALSSCWTDDMTLGWVYQYWNDPEREALDDKLNENKKLENHELASKTQMFTERYMVEWLLHNSLGQMWLAICQRHGWTPEVVADGTLDRLEARRVDWRAKREAGQVALDALMPIESAREERWKYWVPQPLPEPTATGATGGQPAASVRDLKLLDIAVGSGHFLVVALDLLFALYQEEARQRGQAGHPQWSDRAIVESIFERNLHGIDIDPRAVQIAAAALMLKARQLAHAASPRTMNLVAAQLRLANLPDDDAALVALRRSIQHEVGLPPALTDQIVHALSGADHLGTLLKADAAVDAAIAQCETTLSAPGKPTQGDLYSGFVPERRSQLQLDLAKRSIIDRLEEFLAHHGGRDDLGLRLRGEQLATGIRLLRMLRENQYDLVIGNPPYQGTSKMADASYVQEHYRKGKADLYAAFLERALQLTRAGGTSALLTMRNWMFIKQYAAIREWLLQTYDLRMLGDVDRGAFEEVPNEVLAAVMSIFRKHAPSDANSIAMQPTPLDDKSYDRARTTRKRAAVLCQVGRFEFDVGGLKVVPGWPLAYWWSESELDGYVKSTKISDVGDVKTGLQTSKDPRFLRYLWEVANVDVGARWALYVSGAAGRRWFDPLEQVVTWGACGYQLRTFPKSYVRNEAFYFRKGIAFSDTGSSFSSRLHRHPAIIGDKAPSIFPADAANTICVLNASSTRWFMESLCPGLDFQVGDVLRVPLFDVPDASTIVSKLDGAFGRHEQAREPSLEFHAPGPSPWRVVQEWAQVAVDRQDGEPLPEYLPVYDAEPGTNHLSFAIGVSLGRFGSGGGVIVSAPEAALPHGVLFVSEASEHDSLEHPACAPVIAAWETHGHAIDEKRSLRDYLRDKFFGDVHRSMYENRPIYFPLSSEKRSFVAYVSIHRWNVDTLRALLAEHLQPAMTRLEGEMSDLRTARNSDDKKAARDAERRYVQVDKWRTELAAFISNVEQCAEKGPPPPDNKTTARERDARYDPDLDDGVMINSAALWPLLDPQWKDPKKWWRELANAQGKKDYDWAHLSARYFPTRVYAKCITDPSLAVAHGCFWKLHPALAYKWELRLQDEIAPDFTLDEPARSASNNTSNNAFTDEWVQLSSDDYRTSFETSHPDKVDALVAAEAKRRERKAKKAGEDEDDPSDGPLLDRANDEDDEEVDDIEAEATT